jgi:hypothetical protein
MFCHNFIRYPSVETAFAASKLRQLSPSQTRGEKDQRVLVAATIPPEDL